MQTEPFRILIASTEKTGNTWLKLLLARIYDLPQPYIGHNFSASEADALGSRWVTHQHFMPEPPLLEWAAANQTWLLTTVRHPADTLVSLYHYCCNYADHYKDDLGISRALRADAAAREASAGLPHHIVDGELIRALQGRIMCDVNISISWIQSRRSIVVRYEDLRTDPLGTLERVTSSIAPVSADRIEQAIKDCDLEKLRETKKEDSRFFRRALVGESRSVLPAHILRRFAEEEPFKSQLAFLSYHPYLDVRAQTSEPARSTPAAEHNGDRFDNGVPFVPVVGRRFYTLPVEKREQFGSPFDTSRVNSFFQWLNSPAEEDPFAATAVPSITNVAAFIYQRRPDLRLEFPDCFDRGRLGYAGWFLRYGADEYKLDERFLTPVALSWLGTPLPLPQRKTVLLSRRLAES